MRPDYYRMRHPAIACRACLALHGKAVPAEGRQWLKPAAGHAMFLTVHGPMKACDLGASAATVPARRFLDSDEI
jgi:hypothetical protein